MRRIASLFVLAACVALPAAARADDDDAKGEKGRPVEKGTFGAGLILGEPTGICMKLYVRNDQAIQAAAGFAFVGGGIQLDGDYVFHPWILQDKDTFVLPVYIGPGLRLIDYSDGRGTDYFAAGLRAVIGMVFDFKNVPLDAFVEVAGIAEYRFATGKGLGVSMNLGAGIRYYF